MTYNRNHITLAFTYVRTASNNHVFGLLFTEDDTWGWIHEHAIDFPSDGPPPKRRSGSRVTRSAEQVEKQIARIEHPLVSINPFAIVEK